MSRVLTWSDDGLARIWTLPDIETDWASATLSLRFQGRTGTRLRVGELEAISAETWRSLPGRIREADAGQGRAAPGREPETSSAPAHEPSNDPIPDPEQQPWKELFDRLSDEERAKLLDLMNTMTRRPRLDQ